MNEADFTAQLALDKPVYGLLQGNPDVQPEQDMDDVVEEKPYSEDIDEQKTMQKSWSSNASGYNE